MTGRPIRLVILFDFFSISVFIPQWWCRPLPSFLSARNHVFIYFTYISHILHMYHTYLPKITSNHFFLGLPSPPFPRSSNLIYFPGYLVIDFSQHVHTILIYSLSLSLFSQLRPLHLIYFSTFLILPNLVTPHVHLNILISSSFIYISLTTHTQIHTLLPASQQFYETFLSL